MTDVEAVKAAIAKRYGIFPMIEGDFTSGWGVRNLETRTWVCRHKSYEGATQFLEDFLATYYQGLGLSSIEVVR